MPIPIQKAMAIQCKQNAMKYQFNANANAKNSEFKIKSIL